MRVNYLNTEGIILIIIYLLIIFTAFSIFSANKYRKDKQLRKYFKWSLLFKLLAGIGFALIYDFYYGRAGDTFTYFANACRMGDVLFKDPITFFKLLIGYYDKSNVHEINHTLGYMPNFRDPGLVFTHRLLSIFSIIGLKHYYLTIICLNVFLFVLNWKTFRYLSSVYTNYKEYMYLGFLLIPSVLFWNSGITKDSFSFSFTILFVAYFHKIFFKKKFGILNIFKILFCIYIIISLKPYILYAAIVSGLLWIGFSYTYLVKNRILRVFVFPALMFIIGIGGMWILSSVMGIVGGAYQNIDSMLGKAVVSQQDLKQDYYQGNSFDIGDYDPTLGGAASVTPAAIIAGLYRPFIWEANSVVMLLSGFENLILLLLTVYIIIRAGPLQTIIHITKEPFLVFCLSFSLSMALGIGLSTSNFGALVRFKIPMLPFFLMMLLIIFYNVTKQKRELKASKKAILSKK